MDVVAVAEIAAQRDQVVSLVRAFDPSVVSAAECKAIVGDVSLMINALEGMRARAAAKVASTSLATEDGARSAACDLAVRTGVSAGEAQRAIELGARLAEQPEIAAALASGRVSLQQAALVSDAAAARPVMVDTLLEVARTDSLKGLRTACDKVKKQADPDPVATTARVHAARKLRVWTDGDLAKLFGEGTKGQIVAIRAAIDDKTDQLFNAARAEGRREPREAYAMDALEAICREWTAGSSSARGKAKPTAIVHVDYESLVGDGDQVAEIDGLGPIDLPTAGRLLGDALLYLVIHKGEDVNRVLNLSRQATVAQQIALMCKDRGHCLITVCDSPRLEIHHHGEGEWNKTHTTMLWQLRRPCKQHHELLTRGWTSPNTTTDTSPSTHPAPTHDTHVRGTRIPIRYLHAPNLAAYGAAALVARPIVRRGLATIRGRAGAAALRS